MHMAEHKPDSAAVGCGGTGADDTTFMEGVFLGLARELQT